MRMLGTLAVTAAVAMVFGACSSEDNMVADNGATDGSTAVRGVTVTVSAGIGDNTDPTPAPPLDGRGVAGAVTRSAVVTGTDAETGKTTRTLKFTSGDKLYVYCKISNSQYKAGMLTMVGEPTNDGKNATFTGKMAAYKKSNKSLFYPNNNYDFGDDPLEGTTATLVHEGMKSKEESEEDYDYALENDGYIKFDQNSASDVETLMTKCLQVTGDYVSGSGYTLTAGAIFNCTFTGLEAETEYILRLHYPLGNGYYSGTTYCDFTTDENGTGTVAFAPDYTNENAWEIRISKYENNAITNVGSFDLGTRAFEAGKIYNVRRHWNGEAFEKTIPLETLTSDIIVPNGYTLTGTLTTPVKISIADGATVTLDGVTIDGKTLNSEDSWNILWSGLTCLGNANIVLADNSVNTVTYFNDPAGILVGPEGTTLTISGGTNENAGKLTAEGKGGAGIGGWGDGKICGNIIINGGDITAISKFGAGIGSSMNGTCGDITINAYKVWAENTVYGAGIGCGQNGNCGDITISAPDGFSGLTAKKIVAHRPIGLYADWGNYYCGKITLFGIVIYDPNDTENGKDYNLDSSEVDFSRSDNDTWIFKPFD